MSEDLAPTWVVGSIDLTYEPFMVDRENTVDIGEPEMVVETLASQLADGDIERTVRYGNRTYVIPIYVTGPTLADVADAEALLRAELRRPGLTLTHNPGDSWAVDSVYEVQTARMTPSRDDTHESHLIRKFTLTLACGPFARSAAAVTVEALGPPPVTPTTVTVNDATSTTGWVGSAASGPVAVTDLGADGVSVSANSFSLSLYHEFSIPVVLTGTQYLTVEASGSTITAFRIRYSVGDLFSVTPAAVRALPTGRVQYTLPVDPAKSLARLHLGIETPGLYYADLAINVFDVSRTDTLPQVTDRQITRLIEGKGTERTPASIHVATANGTDALDQVIVHTGPEDGSGYSPPLRRWRTADSTGPETASAIAMSGQYEPVVFAAGGFVAEVPTSSLPEGGYVLMARMAMADVAGGSAEIFWSTSTIFPGDSDQQGFTNGSKAFTFADDSYHLVPLAALSLPSVRTSAGKVQIVIQIPDIGTTDVVLDEAWLFRSDDNCALTIVETDKPHLWLDSADTSSPVPRVWVGEGLGTRVHPADGLHSMGAHTLDPAGTAVFTAALTDNPETDATFYPRWHSNAAE